jgi:hypothetical protein
MRAIREHAIGWAFLLRITSAPRRAAADAGSELVRIGVRGAFLDRPEFPGPRRAGFEASTGSPPVVLLLIIEQR